ncbi:MAG TPA: alpha/beta fold hydrolase [Gemmata sp.]|nr:alpha/beta fold hydrolase [Gemmata sp.]
MIPSLPLVVAVFAAPAAQVPTEVWQVAPDAKGKPGWLNTPRTHDRAVLLIPGLKIHPLRPMMATRPFLRDWQQPTSELVRELAKDFDVFAFGYAQTVPLDAVAEAPSLRSIVAEIRKAGYTEIVLIGHSAGGVIARLFVENYPDAGVTKVITVAAPHAGSDLANLKVGYPRAQAPFVQSLTKNARSESGSRPIPAALEMACVVCKLKRFDGDGLVSIASQWPEECRKIGIPVVLQEVNHWEAMLSAASAKTIGELAREKLTRWNAEQVDKARKILFGSPAPQPNRRRTQQKRARAGSRATRSDRITNPTVA